MTSSQSSGVGAAARTPSTRKQRWKRIGIATLIVTAVGPLLGLVTDLEEHLGFVAACWVATFVLFLARRSLPSAFVAALLGTLLSTAAILVLIPVYKDRDTDRAIDRLRAAAKPVPVDSEAGRRRIAAQGSAATARGTTAPAQGATTPSAQIPTHAVDPDCYGEGLICDKSRAKDAERCVEVLVPFLSKSGWDPNCFEVSVVTDAGEPDAVVIALFGQGTQNQDPACREASARPAAKAALAKLAPGIARELRAVSGLGGGAVLMVTNGHGDELQLPVR